MAGSEVEDILAGLGLGDLAPRFAAEDIDGAVFLLLRDEDLRELGLTLGQRRRIMDEIARRRPAATGATDSVPGPEQQRCATARPGLELRRLTVVIADIVGSTQLATRLGPDGMHDLLQAFYGHARAVAERHGGHFRPMQGDGALLLFGYPLNRGGTAERALAAALQLQADLAARPHVLADGSSLTLRARAGVATGKALVGYPDGAGLQDGLQIVGPVVNRAARLQALADPGGVVAESQTTRLAACFAVQDLPPAQLKGFDEAVTVHRVLGRRVAPPDLPPQRSIPQSAHVTESDALAAAWRDAAAGGSGLFVITGEAGIGKSTLVGQLIRVAMSDGADLLRLGCSSLSANMPLAPIAAAMRAAADGAAPMDALRALLGDVPTGDLHGVAALLGLEGAGAGTLRRDERGRLLGLLAARLLDGKGRARLIVVEDLHWADATTRDLLEDCARRAGRQRGMIVATSRREDEPLWSAAPGLRRIALQGLSTGSARAVLGQVLGGRVLPAAIETLILARSGGNPLMIESLARRFESWSDADLRHGTEVPTSIYDSLSGRIDALTLGRDLAEAISVFDSAVGEATLALAVDMQTEELSAAAVELCAAGITEWAVDGPRRSLTFRHSLYREVIHERLVRARRQRLHRAAYRALIAAEPALAEDAPAILAWHADEAGDHAQAAPLALRAGEAALARSALIEAGFHFDRALSALGRLGHTRELDLLRLRSLTGLASVKRAREGIASDEAGRLGRAVLALARDLGETRTELLALNGLYTFALVRADYRAAGSWAQELDHAAELAQDATFRMIAMRAMGVVALHTGSPVGAAGRLRQALDLYDRDRHLSLAFAHGYDHAEICAVFLSFALWLGGDLVASAEVGAYSIDHSRAIDHAHSLAQALTFRAMLLTLARDEAGARAAARESVEVGARFDLKAMHGVGEYLDLAAHLLCREQPVNVADAELLHERHGRFRAVNPYNYQPVSLTFLAEVFLRAGLADRAAAALAEAEAVQDRTGEIWTRPEVARQKARLALMRGDVSGARSLLSAALADAAVMGAVALELRVACELALPDGDEGARAIVAATLARLGQQDDGWDVRRAQSVLGILPG